MALKEEILEKMAKDAAMQAELEKQRKEQEARDMERKAKVDAVIKKLIGATRCKDIIALNSAIDQAVSMGLQTDEVSKAQDMLSNLGTLEEARGKINSALKMLGKYNSKHKI